LKKPAEPYKAPPLAVSLVPVAVLMAAIAVVVRKFGSDSLNGASQVALLISAAVAAAISVLFYRTGWRRLENAIVDNVRSVTTGIIILLLIGAVAGTWMTSGIVPTFICYGLKIISPRFFLLSTCLICAVVSLITGSSWTTVATVGVALLGVGRAQGFETGWIAGAIISGAYFGDKISPLSDTTVMASSVVGVPLFTHVKYMLVTTVPSLVVALAVFGVAGFSHTVTDTAEIARLSNALSDTFDINGWLMIVPLLTCVMIAFRLPSMVTLFCSAVAAAVAMLVFQPQILPQIVEGGDAVKAFFVSICGYTSVSLGLPEFNDLVATRGMAGMMNTVWLIVCAMCFGGVMIGSGMLGSIVDSLTRRVRSAAGSVAATVGLGIFCNTCTADQYLSIILTGKMMRSVYERNGLEGRLLSRATEDSATVTSVLVPWNTCGMTQSTVLGIATLTYLPYCIFNLVSPLMSILIAATGYKIKHLRPDTAAKTVQDPKNGA